MVSAVCVCACVALAPLPGGPDGVLRLLADDPQYQAAKAQETTFEGKLERDPTRPAAYRLAGREDGKPATWPLFLPKPPPQLNDHVNKQVRITGKLVDGQLWPARLEAPATVANERRDGVLARSTWQPEEARKQGARQYVIRSDAEAARLLGSRTPGLGEHPATDLLARRLGVVEIDWGKQMVVCVCAGLRGADVERLVVTRVERRAGGLTVS